MMLPAPYTATATTYIAGDASGRAAVSVANGIATAHVRVAAMNAFFKSQLSTLNFQLSSLSDPDRGSYLSTCAVRRAPCAVRRAPCAVRRAP